MTVATTASHFVASQTTILPVAVDSAHPHGHSENRCAPFTLAIFTTEPAAELSARHVSPSVGRFITTAALLVSESFQQAV